MNSVPGREWARWVWVGAGRSRPENGHEGGGCDPGVDTLGPRGAGIGWRGIGRLRPARLPRRRAVDGRSYHGPDLR
jgi:hypothetical protein